MENHHRKTLNRIAKESFFSIVGVRPIHLKEDAYLLLAALALTILWYCYLEMTGTPILTFMRTHRCPTPTDHHVGRLGDK